MNDHSGSVLRFLKGQEICQIAFGMYDLQSLWAAKATVAALSIRTTK